MSNALSTSFAPRNIQEAMEFCGMLAKSTIVPKDFQNNPGNIMVAVQWGMELGLQPMQAMQSIAVINGRPALWGDAVIALVRSSSLCEYVKEEAGVDYATCTVKRRGEDETSRIFTMAQAKQAGLIGKQGPWTQYPQRMLQLRARAFALRDVFADVLRGMAIAEEVQDMPENQPRNTGAANVVQPAALVLSPIDLQPILDEVAAYADADALAARWKELASLCNERKDMPSHTAIKAAVAARGKAIKEQAAAMEAMQAPEVTVEIAE